MCIRSNLTGKIHLSNNFSCPCSKKPRINTAAVADQKQALLYLHSSSLVPRMLRYMVKQNTTSSSYHSTHFSCASYFYSSRFCPGSHKLLHMGGYGKGFCLLKQMAILPCSLLPEILLFFLTQDGIVKAHLVTAGVCRFAFSDILFLAQLHCLRYELVTEHRVVLVRRCCLGGQ